MGEDLDIIRRLTGISDDSRILFNDVGWASRAYLIDGGRIVFKFPRYAEARYDYAREVESLKLIKGIFPNVPEIEWWNDANDYIGFYGVIGEPLEEEFPMRPSVDQQRIGMGIGEFLQKLHSLTPPKNALKMSVQDEINRYQEKYQKLLNEIQKHLSDDELGRVDSLFYQEMPNTMIGLGEEPVFCHGDLQGQNIIVLGDSNVGIIDFGDTGVYDRSFDFVWMEGEMLENALYVYGDSETLRHKIAIRRKCLPIFDLEYYISKGDENSTKHEIDKIRNRL